MTASPTARIAASAVTAPLDRPVASTAALLSLLPRPTGSVCFVGGDRGGDRGAAAPGGGDPESGAATGDRGFVGWGVHAKYTATGPNAATRIQEWFEQVRAGLRVTDPIGAPGTGPLAFVSLGFDDSDVAVAVVPQVVVGRSAGIGFVTRIGPAAGVGASDASIPQPIRLPGPIRYADAELSVAGFTSAVQPIRRGELDPARSGRPPGPIRYADAELSVAGFTSAVTTKVVLAHDLVATAARPVDERLLLARLAARYPGCWTFDVEGLVGASPELLIRRQGRRIASRVLAGTAWREHRGDAVADDLLHSPKDVAEHAYAVRSVGDVLSPVCVDLHVPARPRPLELAHLTHLSTDITGRLGGFAPTALELAARLHPTAAVGGTPTELARQVIRELEPASRGRYAAPVGWIDGRGDGEFAIALRCAQVNGRSVRLMAGCGIVADSDPGHRGARGAGQDDPDPGRAGVHSLTTGPLRSGCPVLRAASVRPAPPPQLR